MLAGYGINVGPTAEPKKSRLGREKSIARAFMKIINVAALT